MLLLFNKSEILECAKVGGLKLGAILFYIRIHIKPLRACLHGVGDPGLVGLVSFVFTLWGTQNKRNLPH